MINFDILWRCALCLVAGWFLGFLSTRSALKEKYKPGGLLKIVYDQDNPSQPVMGVEIESLHYILTNPYVLLAIEKKGFPKDSLKA